MVRQNYNDPRVPSEPSQSDGMIQYQEKQNTKAGKGNNPLLSFRGYRGMTQQTAYDAANEAIAKTAIQRFKQQRLAGAQTYNTTNVRNKRLFAGGN